MASYRAAASARARLRRALIRLLCTSALLLPATSHAAPQSAPEAAGDYWIAPDSHAVLAAQSHYSNAYGQSGLVLAHGPVDMAGHPFFSALGTNGRACVSCHQPSSAMGLSLQSVRQRWQETQGKDPLFAAFDGSNCPNLPQEKPSSHSLLLNRGLLRVALPWPRKVGPDGTPVDPEFTIEVVRDPTGCNTDPKYGLGSADPHISVFRRPRMVANLKYVAIDAGGEVYGPAGPFNAKRLAMVMDRDPQTGQYVAMNTMSDARAPTLKMQAQDAARDHLQSAAPLTDAQVARIVDFESDVFAAQVQDLASDDFSQPSSPPALGPLNLQNSKTGVLGDNFANPTFKTFEVWKSPATPPSSTQAQFHASVMRGYEVFFNRPFWIRDSAHINTAGLGNPAKRTCVTCHNLQMVGTDATAGWGDLGTNNEPWADESVFSPAYDSAPQLPLFKVVCREDARPHPFLGRVIFTHDPGRALISGKCYDVGSVVMGQLRGLAARAPYFASGSAQDLGAVVDFYDRRFNIGFSAQERLDLINFLSVL